MNCPRCGGTGEIEDPRIQGARLRGIRKARLPMHNCPITGCPNSHGDGLVMCRDHWMKVARDLRDRLTAAKKGTAEWSVASMKAIRYAGVAG